MLSPLGWLNAAAAVAVREIQRLLRTPQEIIVCGFLPIFWVLVVWLLLGNGIVTQVPTGIVDNDHSQLSRDVISKIDATRSVGLVPFASHSEADLLRFLSGTHETSRKVQAPRWCFISMRIAMRLPELFKRT